MDVSTLSYFKRFHEIPLHDPVLEPGVYFLVEGGVVTYIGQSRRPLARVLAHKNDHRKQGFDSAYVLPCKADRLDLVEAALIAYFRPEHNSVRGNCLRVRFESEKQLKAVLASEVLASAEDQGALAFLDLL